ncbi:MAG: mannose-6-phosphate isomerase, class I [Candidatus Marinimicrobia bacterium]|jgi:mannose-6-phosphate isomerase|nr:mannose-6-phosphate isomerase, class I [Candidatus Neomarinimicrobiota bacterium]MBT4360526.1 mannose-6-phosphate isomerase, class I [Candidatus Neomarinimicrobiota bacterium]MBT4716279.1 mannose-6-phosphate isomerase, class I [Candidatus Neomarinimicrobiota bacterium]MBT4945259.1 mannose-6-phosphate isomerase, class I [Candidatus Neomarinimicrobiota bacterium]MBT5269173.1 mannose-6-phosphate isomerase, class I [Candidatus Neomarinimicrobiota bacterium]
MLNEKNSDCQFSRPYRLENTIQHYDWGTRNHDAYITELLGINPEPGQAYAELWMGVHPNAPSSIIDLEEGPLSLSKWISESPQERLSTEGKQSTLPYLFKVLSAGEALSIQAHPNKLQAENLHQLDPEHYPDSNHKPEIAIAIDYLDALIGFISDQEFAALLEACPELKSFLNRHSRPIGNLKEGVQELFHIWEHDGKSIAVTTKQIHQRLSKINNSDETEMLFLDQFEKRGPEDIGLLFLFFLKRVKLGPGEAVFLAPGVPHAYLKGNILECMANSDNVVRLGLTSKFCDAKALQDILVYDGNSDFRIPQSKRGHLSEYVSPVSEFRIKSVELAKGQFESFTSRTNLTMFLLLEGEISLLWGGKNNSCTCILKRGHSFITPANLSEFDMLARMDAKLYLVEIP